MSFIAVIFLVQRCFAFSEFPEFPVALQSVDFVTFDELVATSATSADLSCSFDVGSCQWVQQIDFTESNLAWNHVTNPPRISLLSSTTGGFVIPQLMSPKVKTSRRKCFRFTYQSNVAFSLVRIWTGETSPGTIIHRAESDQQTNSKVQSGFATLDAGRFYMFFDVDDDVHEDIKLSFYNFQVVEFDGSVCEEEDRLSRKASATEIVGERSLRFSDVTKACEWISFGQGGFDETPEVIMQTKLASDLRIRANVEYVGYEGFRVCAYKPRSLRNGDINLEWKASKEKADCFDRTQFKCNSGECISRRAICDGHANCISADDETTELCSAAMGTLAFSTFASTIMATYLLTYRKYVKDLRRIMLAPLEQSEDRLESIHMRELSRESRETSQVSTITILAVTNV